MIGKRIKEARKNKGLTQEELGNMVGVQKSAIAKWENGRVSEIKRTNLKKLAEALDLNPNSLLDDIENDPVKAANQLADIYLDSELMELIKIYTSLDKQRKNQVRDFIHFMSSNDKE